MNPDTFLSEVISLEGIESLSYLPNLLLILIILALLWIGKKVFDLFSNFSLEYQLVKADNKAITVSFVGYLGGVAAILEGVIKGGSTSLLQEIIDVSIWGIIGILLLNLAGKINNQFILRQFNSKKELLENHNVGVGVVVASGYIGSALIIRSIIQGESLGIMVDIGLTLAYFVLGQIAFFAYSHIYQLVIGYDFHKEIEGGNVAAGISLGLNLAAIGVLLAIPLRTSYSLLLFLSWFVLGSSMMAFFRFVMDRIIIPMEKLDEEIHQDQNWGVALLEGCFSVTAVVILQTVFG